MSHVMLCTNTPVADWPVRQSCWIRVRCGHVAGLRANCSG